MRRIAMFNRVSADGYFAAEDGNRDWVVPEPEIDKEAAAGIPENDTVVFGRKTYEMFASFWPKFVEDARVTDPHDPGRRSPEMEAMGRFLDEASKIVFSRTLRQANWKNTRIERELVAGEIERLKKEPGKGILVFGSGSIVSRLTEHGLIDEYRFVVCPVLLGGGKPLLREISKRRRLVLAETKKCPSGNVLLRYESAKP